MCRRGILDFLDPVLFQCIGASDVLLGPLQVGLPGPAAHNHDVLALLFVLEQTG